MNLDHLTRIDPYRKIAVGFSLGRNPMQKLNLPISKARGLRGRLGHAYRYRLTRDDG